MAQHLETLFPPEAQKRIADAVQEAESRTSGEIIPYLVPQSDHYEEAYWLGAAIGLFTALTAFALWFTLSDEWIAWGYVEMAAAAAVCAALMAVCVHFVPLLRRALAGNKNITHRVTQRAIQAFLSEEVFNTRERTGVLLFLSLFERRVIVLGDSGINAKVSQQDWDAVVAAILAGIKAGKPADGFIEAIRMVGDLLQKHGVERRADDTDELSNNLRIGGER